MRALHPIRPVTGTLTSLIAISTLGGVNRMMEATMTASQLGGAEAEHTVKHRTFATRKSATRGLVTIVPRSGVSACALCTAEKSAGTSP
jgi:hypothetical protein